VAGRPRSTAHAIDLRARRLRVLVVDVDGVLTDGRILVDARGGETRAFHTGDRAGFGLLARAGIRVVGLVAHPPRTRPRWAPRIELADVLQGGSEALASVRRYCGRRRVALEQVAYVGGDVLGLPLLAAVGLAAAVRDAAPPVRRAAHWVTSRPGGAGVGWEVSERILRAQGRWASTVGEAWRHWD
jgi:3-deoxy-D-manno-octulosonate 8-phosphate phosphatase (KDO 8-P phosphatase)